MSEGERGNDRDRDRDRNRDRDRQWDRRKERERDHDRHNDDRRHGDDEWQRRFGGKKEEERTNLPFRGHERSGPQKDLPNPFFNKDKNKKPDVWGKQVEEEPVDKEQKNFSTSGALSKALRTDDKTGIELKYIEPEEGAMPGKKWRLYPFKGDQGLEPYKVYRQTYYLFGRDRHVAHIPVDHPSCSKQHAVLQFRMVHLDNEDTGTTKTVIRPYIMDLGSTNGTYLNGVRVDDKRYIELKEKDVLKFGNSTREFVLLHEGSVQNAED